MATSDDKYNSVVSTNVITLDFDVLINLCSTEFEVRTHNEYDNVL